jgi:hypothetical protein
MEYPLKDKYKGYVINLDTGDTGNTITFNTTINEEKISDKNIESLKSRIDTIIANQFEEYDIILDMKSTIMLFTVIGETEDGNKLILKNNTTPRYVIWKATSKYVKTTTNKLEKYDEYKVIEEEKRLKDIDFDDKLKVKYDKIFT